MQYRRADKVACAPVGAGCPRKSGAHLIDGGGAREFTPAVDQPRIAVRVVDGGNRADEDCVRGALILVDQAAIEGGKALPQNRRAGYGRHPERIIEALLAELWRAPRKEFGQFHLLDMQEIDAEGACLLDDTE